MKPQKEIQDWKQPVATEFVLIGDQKGVSTDTKKSDELLQRICSNL